MHELVSIFLIGISLSMDTFSLSLTLSPIITTSKYNNLFPLIVALFHFTMPNLGNLAGIGFIQLFNIANNYLLGTILIILGIGLLVSYLKDEEPNIRVSFIGVIILAFSVSMDSFTVGIGLAQLAVSDIIVSFVFALCSFAFTSFGLIIGKYSQKSIGKYANILGICLLFVLGIYHLLK